MKKSLDNPTIPAFIVLALVLIVVQWVRLSLAEPERTTPTAHPTASVRATTPAPHPAATAKPAPATATCPGGVTLPYGVDPRVCGPVSGDLTDVGRISVPNDEPVTGFRSPGGSLACADIGVARRNSEIACAVDSWTFDGDYPYPGGKSDSVSQDTALVLTAGSAAPSRPYAPTDVQPAPMALDQPDIASVLDYDQVVRMAPDFYCIVQKVGVSCWNPSTKSGLFLAQDRWISWGAKGVLSASS